MKFFSVAILFLIGISFTKCCSSQKNQNAPAREVLPERNSKDVNIDSLKNKKVDVAIPTVG